MTKKNKTWLRKINNRSIKLKMGAMVTPEEANVDKPCVRIHRRRETARGITKWTAELTNGDKKFIREIFLALSSGKSM